MTKKEKDTADLASKYLHHAFAPEFYPDGTASLRSMLKLVVGNKYIIVHHDDSDSQYYLSTLVKEAKDKDMFSDLRGFLLFFDEKEKNYYLVKPKAFVNNMLVDHEYLPTIQLELEIRYNLGKDYKKPYIIQKEKVISLE